MNIRVDLNTSIKDGLEVVFRSPVDCSQVTGLIVYYNDDSKEFAFADAHGNNVGDIDHLFAENVVVKVILDVTNGMAFVQNADTNTYLEEQFAKCVKTVNGTAPDKNGNVVLQLPSGGGADGLSFDETTGILYLMSGGQIIEGSGIQLPASGGGTTNNAVLTLENTTGWSNKTIPNNQPTCTVSFRWSSVEGDVSTGTGTLVVKVAGELRHTALLNQGEHTLNIFDYLSIGYNLVQVTVTDFYGNSQTIPFGVTMYDTEALISTKLVERTLTGDYTNDRVTKVGNSAFTGLTLGRLSLPNVTAVEENGLGATATEIELESLPELYYRAFMGGDIDVVKVPSVVKLTHNQALFLDKKINRMIFNCVNLETSGNPLTSSLNKVVTFDFHRLKSLPAIPGGSTRTVIIRTPEVCALQTAPGTTAVNVYTPASLVDSYKSESNWSEMADKIFAIEDYPDICEVSDNA